MIIKLYKTKTLSNKVDKVLTNELTIEGEPTDSFSIVRPSFVIGQPISTIEQYNYMYVPTLHRYYWLAAPVVDNEEVILSVYDEDYLASWKTDIKNATCRVTRSASNNDKFIADNMIINKNKTITYQRKIGNGFTKADNFLVLIGG